jgi:hypothetical protein
MEMKSMGVADGGTEGHAHPLGAGHPCGRRAQAHAPDRACGIAAQTRDNCLFLSAAAQLNHEQLGTIYRHFAESCLSDESDAHHPMMFSRSPLFHEERRPQLLQLLRAADVGIIDFCVREQRTAIEDTIGKLREFQLQDEAEKLAQRLREEGEPKMIHLGHRAADGSTVFFEPDEESDGTISLINRLHAILLILQRGGLWIVDELDRSLHPHLCAALLELFTDPTTNPRRAQVVFSSHDRALLERLRRDEVVLVDKHHDNASVITRMSDFKVLKREHIQQVYADGRVGGVPILGDLRRALRAAGSEATLEREPSASTVTP